MIIGKNGFLMATGAVALLLGSSPVLAAGDMSESEMQSGSQNQAAELVGTDIRTSGGEDIGSVESVVYDSEGDIAAVIVDVESEYGSGYLDDPLEENTHPGENTGRNEPDG